LAWLALAALGVFGFLKNIRKRDNSLPFAFIGIMLFSFGLHLQFGKEIFLYAVNWTYALVFFLALGWQEFAQKRWFQAALLIFLCLALANNARLLAAMLGASAQVIR
jgi:hypothetical protein